MQVTTSSSVPVSLSALLLHEHPHYAALLSQTLELFLTNAAKTKLRECHKVTAARSLELLCTQQ